MSQTFYFPADAQLHLGSAKHKADTNLEIFMVLKKLDEQARSATTEEQILLSHYVGWGDSSVLSCRYSEVADAITDEEFKALQASTLNAHYTALPIIRAMWSGIARLGAHKHSSMRILDPSAGIGHFRSVMHESMRNSARWVEIELDLLTARILKQLHPDVEGQSVVFNDGFEDVRLIENQFDLAISNVPFGNYPINDRSIKESFLKSNIHDYFFVKALSLVRPGGVIAFITSRYTLDKKNKTTREWLARRADLLAAVRLPDTTFIENAGTQVVTDIVFLRKRDQMLKGSLPLWVDTEVIDPDVHCYDDHDTETDGKIRQNRIYGEHPEWIIGKTATRRGMYTRGEYTVKYDGDTPVGDVVAEILENVLPENAMVEGYRASIEQNLVVDVTPSSHVIQISQNTPVDHMRRLEGLREIYDAAQQLLDMEIKRRILLEIEMQREKLNCAYDKYVMRFGPISNKLHQKLLDESPALPFLLALECDYQPLTNSAQKALIFRESTVRSAPAPDKIQNCNDALLFCLNQTGNVDIGFIAELAGVTEEQAFTELGDRIVWTPEGQLVASDVYLSGNIAEKLEKAKAMVGIEPRLKNTIDSLQKAMPKPLKPGQIKARLGSGWIPSEYVCQFVEHLLPGVTMQATYIPKLGSWTLDVKRGFVPAENTSKYGTKRYSALALLETGLNAQTPIVYDTIDEDGHEKRILNQQETVAAQAKLEELKTRFDTWLWQDAERAERLAQIYNTRFNVFARPHYDGSHLTMPGLSNQLTLRSLQKDAVWFGLQRLATLIGDEVGLGKTLTAIVSVMEAIRLGAAHKAVVVVPNHLTGDWRDAFLLAYPHAKVLCAGKNDLKKNKRREFMSRIAMNRWDAVIIPQSSFKLLPVKPETMNEFIEAEIEELRDFLQKIKADRDVDRRAKKEIEKAIKRFEAKLVIKSDMSKDSVQTITWDQMGIDMMVVDEFHCLPYDSRVLTDRGSLPVGEIVEKRLPVLVKSVDLSTGEVKWMPVTGWFNNPQSAPMARIVHEKGTFECTANHKVWTYEEGYVEAGKLTQKHTLKNLPNMQKGLYPQPARKGRAEASALFPSMPKEWLPQDCNKTLRTMWKGIHLQIIRQKEQRQKKILWKFLRRNMANGTTRTQGISKGIHASYVGSSTLSDKRQTQSRSISSYESEQSEFEARMEKENVGTHVWPHISGKRWEWAINATANICSSGAKFAHRIFNSHRARQRSVQIPSKLLQSRYSGSVSAFGHRDRWADPQREEMEILGQTEDRGTECSRVVSVTFLESESGFRSGSSAQRNKRVFCLEVEGTHNFFAEGVLVSNCYKNLYFHTKMTRIAGLPNTDSQRAFDMFVKVRDLLQRNGRFIGLTGTPIANTMAEAFTLQRYFSYDQLVDMGLSHFDSWAQMFADAVMMPEMTPDGSGFRVNTRLARFTNIPELSAMLSQFMIMRRWKEVSGQVERPALYGGKPTPVRMPGSKPLKEYVKSLAERAQEVRSGLVEPKDDNMLKIVGDGRKAALDLRLVIPNIADLPMSKINTAASNIAEIYHRTKAWKSAQLVFCDLGTPKPHKDSAVVKESEEGEEINPLEIEDDEPEFENVYADIKSKLVKHGVNPAEIAFIHDAKNPAARSLLFQAVCEGRIRVLIGSTEKMGTGMNVQTRALAMHHMDAPWRPADLEQREGRLLRQGNIYSEVFSFVYIVEGSFDGYVWQILETKARFIEQFLNGQTDVREMDDVGETVLSMAEIKALASGNPKIMERVMVQNEILKLEQLRLSWQNERRHSQRRLSATRGELEQIKIRIGHLNIGAQVRDQNTHDAFSMNIGGTSYTERRLAGQQLIELARVVKLEAERTGNEARKKVGSYRGFVMWLRTKPNSERSMQSLMEDPNGGVDILLDYSVPQILVAHVSESDNGTVASVDAAIRSIDGEIIKSAERRDYLLREIQTLEALLKDPWEHAEKLEMLAGKLAQLDQELIAAGITVEKDKGADQTENSIVEIEATEAMVPKQDEEEVIRFDLNEILSRIDEMHVSMLPVEDDEPIAIATPESVGIPVTLESVEALEHGAESARAMAEFSRNILKGTQMRLTDLLDMGLNVNPPAKKSTRKKVEPSQQLRLF